MSASEITHLIQAFNWHNPSWDLFIFLFWAVASVIYAFTAGRGRVVNILMSIYIAKLLVIEAPFISNAVTKSLPSNLILLQQLAAFVIVFLLLFLLLGRFAFRTSADGRQLGSILFGLVFAVLQIGLLISIILAYLSPSMQANFSQLIQTLFIKNPAGFIWLIAPLAYLVALGKHISDPNEL